MAPPPLSVLTEAEKNDLLLAQYEMIERISELEALVGKPRKTAKDDFGKGGKRPSREGTHRPLAEMPD